MEKFNKKAFIFNVRNLIDGPCDGNAKKFNDIVGQRQAFYRWANETSKPRIEALLRICNHFNVSMDWLLGLQKSEAPNPKEQDDKFNMTPEKIDEIIRGYKESAEHYRTLYLMTRSILEALKDPQRGAVEQAS